MIDDKQMKKSRSWLERALWMFKAPWILGLITADQSLRLAFSKSESCMKVLAIE